MIRTIAFIFLLLYFLSACSPKMILLEKGVSSTLAIERAEAISDLEYILSFEIPEKLAQKIRASEQIDFTLDRVPGRLILDFQVSADNLQHISVNGVDVNYTFENGHILLPGKMFGRGRNTIAIDFTAGELSLNRNPEFCYTLFVPDRASTCFPCFDQPDLKASYQLDLIVPGNWLAVANGKIVELRESAGGKSYSFGKTQPVSTYVFAFAAGKIDKVTRTKDGKDISLYHRETDTQRLDANLDEIFRLVFESLDWMEEYTGIPYPFAKYDLITLPSFQYGGMEHTGATLYRSSRLFLDPSATENEILSRAGLIAHETAHMWFGDLVTMKWFDEVWLKEVFANFIAAKIIHPAYPGINHDLKFLMSHYPSAYSIDRTPGKHPVIQDLDNLVNAGSVYGDIIYNKTPVIMKQLELLTGEEVMKSSLQEYLSIYAYGNADWNELIDILDEGTDMDLADWSDTWVYEAGRPEIGISRTSDPEKVLIEQKDPDLERRVWKQHLELVYGTAEDYAKEIFFLDGPSLEINLKKPQGSFLMGGGPAYGYFKLDPESMDYLMKYYNLFTDPLTRGTILVNLYENFLEGNLERDKYLPFLLEALGSEDEALNINHLTGCISTLFWKFMDHSSMEKYSDRLESVLGDRLHRADAGIKRYYFNALVNTALKASSLDRLYSYWKGDEVPEGLVLSEQDRTRLACELAVREYGDFRKILDIQLEDISNPDRRRELEFIIPALSADLEERDAFFNSLRDPVNREHEPWVCRGLAYLHHPLRAEGSEKYLPAALSMLEEIQLTGDIFFPKNWLDACLGGHSSERAAAIVRGFLEENPDYPLPLKRKILQSADLLFRSTGK